MPVFSLGMSTSHRERQSGENSDKRVTGAETRRIGDWFVGDVVFVGTTEDNGEKSSERASGFRWNWSARSRPRAPGPVGRSAGSSWTREPVSARSDRFRIHLLIMIDQEVSSLIPSKQSPFLMMGFRFTLTIFSYSISRHFLRPTVTPLKLLLTPLNL